ncbi:lymphocyte-specific protein 1 isoform X2 [Anolis carolinensis]|uniref:Lymphocyte specific protein 1 n=1 Tax=Anolis carolinensis TaxID=28377 RepID=A0A803T6P0_ANOCA|nr:PREDICTED: lymphocyte-specific protein 1 isoform X1 [Anolis carolinensis]|eukprot:XP_008106244.1 PREDICTED: lymphocyte-specific protein 1 isoform X1 [Anolis carolinensis]
MADHVEECVKDPESDIGVEEGDLGETERLTAQWSVEDEEEAARERRRRERERQLRSQAEEGLVSTSTSSESGLIPQESQIDGKPAGTSELEEDEGFSDWSLKLEQRKQRWAEMGEAAPNGYRTCYGECTEAQQVTSTTWEGRSPKHSCEEDGNLMEAEAKLEQVQLGQDSPTFIRFTPGPSSFLKFVSTSVSQEQPEAELEGQQKLIETACVGEENQDMAEVFPEVQEEIKHEEEEEKQEEKKRRWKEEEEAPEKRQRAPSTSSNEEEGELPLSPTLKITDRTECLNRSIQKSNSVKKTQPPLPVAKIDDKLEQYTHAIETSSKTPKPVRQLSIDLPANSAAVTSTKNLWETGEVVQSPVKTTPCKDIVAGDIVSKRSIWEQKESPNADGSAKVKLPGKKYRYVAIGHGKYKKVLIEDETSAEK